MKSFLLKFRERQLDRLRAHSEETGISMAEFIRRAVDERLDREDRRWEAIREMEESSR